MKGCVAVLAVALAALLVGMLWMMRNPSVQAMLTCRDHLTTLGAALERYHDVNGFYPEKLDDLKEEYLKDPSVLHCPVDGRPDQVVSYAYNRPKPGSPGDFVVLECDRHRLRPDVPKSKLTYLKNGRVDASSPSLREAIKAATEESK